jgi:hypothetical protein
VAFGAKMISVAWIGASSSTLKMTSPSSLDDRRHLSLGDIRRIGGTGAVHASFFFTTPPSRSRSGSSNTIRAGVGFEWRADTVLEIVRQEESITDI